MMKLEGLISELVTGIFQLTPLGSMPTTNQLRFLENASEETQATKLARIPCKTCVKKLLIYSISGLTNYAISKLSSGLTASLPLPPIVNLIKAVVSSMTI